MKIVIYPIEDGVLLEQWDIDLKLKVQGSHIMIKVPHMLRGRTCGLCGDYNQEVTAEFKSPQRCALSSGGLMAASFKVLIIYSISLFTSLLSIYYCYDYLLLFLFIPC